MPDATKSVSTPNPLLLAAENSPELLPLLRSNPSLVSKQDEHGYSLLHAAASYNYTDLARSLKTEFNIDPNIVDEDGETALFVVETVEAAQCLLDDVGTNFEVKNAEGLTAEQKIREEGDYVAIADYLREVSKKSTHGHSQENGTNIARGNVPDSESNEHPPPLPPGVQIHVGTLEEEQNLGEIADLELRRRIEELSVREDFEGEEAQQELRQLITEAVRGPNQDEKREVRPRIE